MKDERFARLRRIVLEMAPLSPDERDAYLRTHDVDERLAAEARKLLDPGQPVSPLLNTDGAAPFAGELLTHDTDALAGRRVGPYLFERELGRGGMGIVYRATQERPIRRDVAIKVLRPEIAADSVMRRFAHEKEVLAQLEHPNVARVLDAGVMDEGLPYVVLELVEGRSITTYSRQSGLPLHERLKIFTEVCAGVEHAHRRGILHRDLKPSNILVTCDGDDVGVKIIDFGIARLLDASGQELSLLTIEGHALGTPRYMSPEQARGERSRMDVRSDVFALGVVLHELATDDVPYDVATTSVLGILRVVAAADTRLLDRTIDGNAMPSDLGTILAKALDPDPERRYGSVSALSEDIECFLEHRPIRARPASLGYQLRKAVQRHPVVAALAATLAVVLVGATVALAVLLQEQRTARALAQDAAASAREETRKATLINDFLQRLLASARPTEEGIDVTVREVVDASALSLEEELGDEPAIQAAIRQTLGKTFMELGDYESALNQLDRALETRYQLGDSSSLETAQTLDDLAEVHWKSYAFDDAVGPLERALEIRRTLLSDESAEVAQSLHNLAMTLNGLPQRREEAMELEQRALAIRRRLYDDRHVKIAESLNGIVSILMREQRYHDAVPRAREVVAIRTELLGSDDPSTVRSASNLAVCLTKTGAFEESAAILREILDIQISLLGDEHPDVAMIHYNLGGSFEHQDSLGAAAVEFRRAMEIRRESLGPTSPRTWFALTRLSNVLEQSGRREAAIALRDSFTTAAQHAPVRAEYLWQNHTALARMLLAEERLEAAEGHLRECVDLLRPSDPKFNGTIAIVRRLAAQLQEKLDDPERVADLRVAIEEVAGAATE